MSELDALRADLNDEHESLDLVVADLSETSWDLPTPSPGWTVRDQIGHLAFFDATATLAIDDPDGFTESVRRLLDGAASATMDDYTLRHARGLHPRQLLAEWRDGRRRLLSAAAALDDDRRVPWYGPSMSAKSFLTARLMETWAHGQDIVDAVSGVRAPSSRLRHIARLGFLTRGWSYRIRELEVPDEEIEVTLTAPDGSTWQYGTPAAPEWVRGSAEEFCLVVTQRRHLDDTDLDCSPRGREWLLIAQAFAGGATTGPSPRASS